MYLSLCLPPPTLWKESESKKPNKEIKKERKKKFLVRSK